MEETELAKGSPAKNSVLLHKLSAHQACWIQNLLKIWTLNKNKTQKS